MLGEGDGPGDGVTVTVWEGKSDGAGTLVGMLKWWWEDCPQLGGVQGQARRLEGCEARMKRFFAVGACPGDPDCRSYSGARVWLRVAIFGQLREEVTVIQLASAKPLEWGGLTGEVR